MARCDAVLIAEPTVSWQSLSSGPADSQCCRGAALLYMGKGGVPRSTAATAAPPVKPQTAVHHKQAQKYAQAGSCTLHERNRHQSRSTDTLSRCTRHPLLTTKHPPPNLQRPLPNQKTRSRVHRHNQAACQSIAKHTTAAHPPWPDRLTSPPTAERRAAAQPRAVRLPAAQPRTRHYWSCRDDSRCSRITTAPSDAWPESAQSPRSPPGGMTTRAGSPPACRCRRHAGPRPVRTSGSAAPPSCGRAYRRTSCR